MTRLATRRQFVSVADLLKDLGNISPERIRLHPHPGKATEKDVTSIHRKEKRLYELVDGVLVEKIMGYSESALAGYFLHVLLTFLDNHDLGMVAGADGAVRLDANLVRIPDVSFVSWDRLPEKVWPAEATLEFMPDLAIEVVSEGNTKDEMKRKVRDYLDAGCRLLWLVDPRSARSSSLLRKVQTHLKRRTL